MTGRVPDVKRFLLSNPDLSALELTRSTDAAPTVDLG
jgi:hypothetical protein